MVLTFLLGEDVAEHAAFLGLEVIPSGAQFVKHSAWYESGRGELRSGMLEFLSRSHTVILEDADVLEARILLQILNALGRQQQKLLDLGIARIPQLPIVMQALHQDLVRTDGRHAIVKTIAATLRLAFNPVQRRGMHHGARRPVGSLDPRETGN